MQSTYLTFYTDASDKVIDCDITDYINASDLLDSVCEQLTCDAKDLKVQESRHCSNVIISSLDELINNSCDLERNVAFINCFGMCNKEQCDERYEGYFKSDREYAEEQISMLIKAHNIKNNYVKSLLYSAWKKHLNELECENYYVESRGYYFRSN